MTLHSSAAWCNETQNHVKDDFKIIKLTSVGWFPVSVLPGYGGVARPRSLVISRSLDNILSLPPATVFTTRSFSQFVLGAITGKLKPDQPASLSPSALSGIIVTRELQWNSLSIDIHIQWNSHLMKAKRSLMIRCCCIRRRLSLEEEGKSRFWLCNNLWPLVVVK